MIKNLAVIKGTSTDPFFNLALERYLLETVDEDTALLYVWQNANTVVIGRNQNPRKECDLGLLKKDGVKLARRLSGGGAVYHDLGNLNFTFLMAEENYDLDRQFDVIIRACGALGIEAVRSGRNDLTAQDGRKFSGNAFYKSHGKAYHHGTLLVSADKEKMTRYLTPSKAKLESKSVDSVRSRVADLDELVPDVTVGKLSDALVRAFGEVYGIVPASVEGPDASDPRLAELLEIQESREWNMGSNIRFDFSFGERFGWGEIEIELAVKGETVTGVNVYSDAMDPEYISELKERLIGCAFGKEELIGRVPDQDPRKAADIRDLIGRQEI